MAVPRAGVVFDAPGHFVRQVSVLAAGGAQPDLVSRFKFQLIGELMAQTLAMVTVQIPGQLCVDMIRAPVTDVSGVLLAHGAWRRTSPGTRNGRRSLRWFNGQYARRIRRITFR